jgi:hypothetical protein
MKTVKKYTHTEMMPNSIIANGIATIENSIAVIPDWSLHQLCEGFRLDVGAASELNSGFIQDTSRTPNRDE